MQLNSDQKGKIGEKFIHDMAYQSFLKYWCYPNPKDEKGDKKEICDLLILFKDTLIIICVKNLEFKGNYDRYFRKSIEKDIKQVYGAERKLTNKEIETFIKHPDREIEKINKKSINKIIRLVVHLGDDIQFYPIFDLSKNQEFVNIFDKDTFFTLVSELDTIPDFIDYLEKREQIFQKTDAIILPKEEYDFDEETALQFFDYDSQKPSPADKKHILISGSECDLLAYYLMNNRQFIEHLSSKELNSLSLQIDGKWKEFIKNKQLLAKKNLDKVSYFIDEFVRKEILACQNPKSVRMAQELLSFNRFERRIISKSFFEFYDRYKDSHGYKIGRRFGEVNGVGIVFIFYSSDMKEEHVNQSLSLAMDSFCIYNGYKNNKMILIATTNNLSQFKYGLVENIVPFDRVTEKAIMEDAKQLGWFTQLQYINWHEKEYPDC
ncbi:MAG: hypothetical protein WC107_03065 [Patescibacteria group bacterium]